ncbi:NUDIX domain-containing protein [Pyrobaculum neutrophilum]|uniref:NUDIX hydrolase n=1 Tax=Pyrobaculum neutrophilum (strain DSM 2338 / JCM 9278 / NBRC 100436 / V24Sta) TaxID=444157 RepID=B1YDT0_PYRNV|nr:NUDIX domain-containing protein [Pyrobaculum neutrophilum]ACB39943.1 NUDIX hydrolase [Pyrobaculum neutrophilum V24Sta]
MCLTGVGYAGGPGWAAVGVLLRGREVLLIRRVERDGDPWSGHVAFPGGMWRPGEDLLGTAVREVEEEVSVRATDAAGALPPLSPGNAPWLKVVPFIFTGWAGEPRPNPREVGEARWVGVDELRETVWRGHAAFEAGGWIIWGLTYRILKRLIDCGLL